MYLCISNYGTARIIFSNSWTPCRKLGYIFFLLGDAPDCTHPFAVCYCLFADWPF